MCSPQSPEEEPGDPVPDIPTVGIENLLRGIDNLIGPEPTGDHSDDRDFSTWDKQKHPIASSIDASPGEIATSPVISYFHPTTNPTASTSLIYSGTLTGKEEKRLQQGVGGG